MAKTRYLISRIGALYHRGCWNESRGYHTERDGDTRPLKAKPREFICAWCGGRGAKRPIKACPPPKSRRRKPAARKKAFSFDKVRASRRMRFF
jgi:hypothetical protein